MLSSKSCCVKQCLTASFLSRLFSAPGCVGPRQQIGMWWSTHCYSHDRLDSVPQYYVQLDNLFYMFCAVSSISQRALNLTLVSTWCTPRRWILVTYVAGFNTVIRLHITFRDPSSMFVSCFFGLKAMAIFTNDVPVECLIGIYSTSTCDEHVVWDNVPLGLAGIRNYICTHICTCIINV